MKFDIEDWVIHNSDIGCHKTGLTVSREKIDYNTYNIKLWNTECWENSLKTNHYLPSEIGIIELGLIYQYILIMNKKEHANNHYIIPMREEIREQIRYNKEYEERMQRKIILNKLNTK